MDVIVVVVACAEHATVGEQEPDVEAVVDTAVSTSYIGSVLQPVTVMVSQSLDDVVREFVLELVGFECVGSSPSPVPGGSESSSFGGSEQRPDALIPNILIHGRLNLGSFGILGSLKSICGMTGRFHTMIPVSL